MAALLLTVALVFGFGQGRAPKPLDDLRAIGDRIVRAVRDKDVVTLLAYDWPDPRSDSEGSLDDPTSDLYCYVFDSRCNRGRPSVLELFSSWRRLRIQARPLEANLAVLYFYDATVVSGRGLKSQKVLCREAGRHIVSWVFKKEQGRWVAAYEPFDFNGESLCR